MARELQQFHLRQRNAQQLEVIRQRRSIGKLLGEGCLRVEGLPGRGPSPQGAPTGREHLPMAFALPLHLFRRQGLQGAPEAELRAGTGQQPTQFHRWLMDELGGLGTAPIGE
jgi:hypothetical protein